MKRSNDGGGAYKKMKLRLTIIIVIQVSSTKALVPAFEFWFELLLFGERYFVFDKALVCLLACLRVCVLLLLQLLLLLVTTYALPLLSLVAITERKRK